MAMYLFTINTMFIALATFLIIKYLRFPMVRYVNSKRRRMISRVASLLAILVMIPGGWTLWNALEESLFQKQARQFIQDKVEPYQFSGPGRFMEDFTDIEFNSGKDSFIELVFMGNENIPDNVIATWKNQIAQNDDYKRLRSADLQIIQGGASEEIDQLKYVNELYESQKDQLSNKDDKIRLLETELTRLRKSAGVQIPFSDISSEARANYENMLSLSYAPTITTDFNKTDTIPIFEVRWKKNAKRGDTAKDAKKLSTWLKLRLKNDKIQLKEIAD